MAIPDKPINRYETYLAKIAGQAVEVPDYPITREEAYLDEIAKNGGGGSDVTVEQIKTSGEKIATITVDGEATDLYASAGGSGGGAVDTVNGKTGDVVLTASDVGALPDNTHIPADQIQSDWEQSDNTKKDYIKNKPTIPAAQVNADWSASSGVAEILHKPTLGTAAAKNVPASGNASSSEVVLGSDSRLSDARNAADVSSWAKAANKPTYTASEVGAIPSTDKGANNGVATLGNDGKVPSSQLPSMSSGHTIKDDGTAMTDRSGLNFIDHDLTDDSSGNETNVKPHRFSREELAEICSPLPSSRVNMPVLYDETGAEYVVGWYKTSQGKKPLYQKTFIFTNYTLTTLDSWTFLVDVPDLHISNSCCFITNSYYVSSAGNFTNTNQIATMSGGSNAYTKSFAIAFDTRHLTSEFSANDCLNIITSVSLSSVTLVFTLRYTKTTDTPE